MVFNSFKIRVILRLALLSLFLGAFFYFVFVTGQYLRSAYFIAFFIIAVVELFWFIDRTNRDLSNFFQSILQSDFTTTFTKKHQGKSFEQLYGVVNEITDKFRKIGAEKEAQFLFLDMLIQHVKVAIVAYDETGKIRLSNDSFSDITGIKYIKELKILKKSYPELVEIFEKIRPEKPLMHKLTRNNELLQLSIVATHFIIEGQSIMLVSLQNIKNELEIGEVDAWQKLIRVLTHEIMNSVTPITSLTDTMLDIVKEHHENQSGLKGDNLDNIYKGLRAIKERNQGLNTFTKAYQSLTRIPTPTFTKIEGEDFIQSIQVLMNADLAEKNITLTTAVSPSDKSFFGDKEQLMQVVINLIKNASEALEKEDFKEIKLIIQGNSDTTISIIDNGPGIPEEFRDQIFIPFFTTKKQGSGIGLALARQVIHLHNGTLKVESSDERTEFKISL